MTLFAQSLLSVVAVLGGISCFGAASTCSNSGRDLAALGYSLSGLAIGIICFLSVAIVSAKKEKGR